VRRVDLRSDTVTQPTAPMREAMATAVVGDDGFGEDPTVAALEARYAQMVGKPAAVLVPSGVMANQIALRVLCEPGDVVVAGRRQHVVGFELGAAARNASVQFATLDDSSGALDVDEVRATIDAEAHHQPHVALVAVENTHMAAGGAPYPIDALEALGGVGRPVHLDGARLFNASVATGVSPARYAACATTVMSCLSKGLCAPVGSVLAGPSDVIARSRIERKRLGGAMRQAGVLAAAGLVALDTMVERLAEDHARARSLAEAVAAAFPDAGYDPAACATNIVAFDVPDALAVVAGLGERGVLADTVGPTRVRLVTHHDVDDDALADAIAALAAVGASR
jgi:threonine aldolase